MYKEWTFLLNVRRNAKKGKRAKDMSWIVNATGWSRLASPISLKQCTHPLRRVCARVILDIVGVMWRQRWWEQRSKISTYWQYSPPASPALRCITRPASSSTQPRPPKNVPTRPKKSRLRHYWIFVSHNSQSLNCQSDKSSEQVIRDLVENFAAPVSAAPFLSINQRISEKRGVSPSKSSSSPTRL